mgnify:CR=1 FL=1
MNNYKWLIPISSIPCSQICNHPSLALQFCIHSNKLLIIEATIFLAHQMRSCDSHHVHMSLSHPSRRPIVFVSTCPLCHFSLLSLTVWKMQLAAIRLHVIFYFFHRLYHRSQLYIGDAKSQQSCDSRQFIDRIGPVSYSITQIILFTRIKVPRPSILF